MAIFVSRKGVGAAIMLCFLLNYFAGISDCNYGMREQLCLRVRFRTFIIRLSILAVPSGQALNFKASHENTIRDFKKRYMSYPLHLMLQRPVHSGNCQRPLGHVYPAEF